MTQSLRLFLSTEHACGYLPGLLARSAFVDPQAGLGATHYQRLLELGFRRSGDHTYRPHCRECARCVPVRLDVRRFHSDRNQRRCQVRNADLHVSIEHRLGDEHYALYRDYLAARHAGGGMDPLDRKAFHAFLECSWLDVRYWCFRAGKQLLAVAVVDHLPRALSAVYTFFDPNARAQPRHARRTRTDPPRPPLGARTRLPRLLGRGQPEDGLQAPFPSAGSLAGHAMADPGRQRDEPANRSRRYSRGLMRGGAFPIMPPF